MPLGVLKMGSFVALVSSIQVFCPSLVHGQFGYGIGVACSLGRDTALLSMHHGVQKMGSYVDLVSAILAWLSIWPWLWNNSC